MATDIKATGEHLNAMIDGWQEHAADATFAGLTLAQFKAKLKPSLDARAAIESLERQLDGTRVDRDNADVVSEEIANNVVNSVKGDPNFGENSALYASFGYVRKDDRKSGLTRAANNLVPVSCGLSRPIATPLASHATLCQTFRMTKPSITFASAVCAALTASSA